MGCLSANIKQWILLETRLNGKKMSYLEYETRLG